MKLHVWLAVLAFNVIIFCCTLPAFLIALVSRVVRCCCGGRQCTALTTATIYACHYSWRWALRLCGCWIRITFNRDKEAPSGLSMVYVANHQSFLDAMLMTAFSPSSTVAKIRMLASAHLMAFPGLSAIICACGHVLIPVVRNKECEAEMSTRGEQIRQRMELYKHHVQRGGGRRSRFLVPRGTAEPWGPHQTGTLPGGRVLRRNGVGRRGVVCGHRRRLPLLASDGENWRSSRQDPCKAVPPLCQQS